MTNPADVTNDLLKEKNLWDVYRLSWDLQTPWAINLPAIMLCVLFFLFSILTIDDYQNLIAQIRLVMDLGITISSTILGFLIAGFTVFATLTNPDLLVTMARSKPQNQNISWLKMTYAVFMHTFAHYSAFLVAVVLLKLLTFPKGIIPYVLSKCVANPVLWKSWLAALGLAVLSGWLFYLVLLLGRFIFNTYHACMLSIAVANEKLLEENRK